MKPIKIQINNGTASGMYILIEESEIAYTKADETKPPNREYKVQVQIEVMHNHKRCNGKRVFSIPKGTSIVKAVGSLLGKREEMKETLKLKGTLKVEKKFFEKIDSKDRKFSNVYKAWIQNKRTKLNKTNKDANTIKLYETCYRNSLKSLHGKLIDNITEGDVQHIIDNLMSNGKASGTIAVVKALLKPLLELNDVFLNWRKIELPIITSDRKFKRNDSDAIRISTALLNCSHPVARGVFAFLLTGRRVGETILMEHKHIDYVNNTFTLPSNITKTETEVTYQLTPILIKAIKSQKTVDRIFIISDSSVRYFFKKAMESIGIYDMVPHDLRSMVAVVALRHGADIYDVSKMLSHKQLSTTERSYLGNGTERATEAQNIFNKLILAPENIVDAEVLPQEFSTLKNLYPKFTDEQIELVMKFVQNL